MKEYSIVNPELEPFLPRIEAIRRQTKAMNAQYYVYLQDSTIVGELGVGVDPFQIYPPPGTKMGFIILRNSAQPTDCLASFIE